MISLLTTSHVPLLVPCHGFAFLMVRWRVKKSTVALWRGRELRVSFCDVCCEIAAVSPEETQTAQWESTLKSGRTLFLILILCAAPAFLWRDFNFTSLHCIPFISFTSQSFGIIHINLKAKRVTSRWSQKPVGPQSELLNDTSAAPCSVLSCCWIIKQKQNRKH